VIQVGGDVRETELVVFVVWEDDVDRRRPHVVLVAQELGIDSVAVSPRK
jgi:hypothetical protein